MSEGVQETKIIFCNICRVRTKHLLRAKYARPHFNFDGGYVSENYENRASIWSCAGCDEVTFEWQQFERQDEKWEDVLGGYFPTREEEDSVQRKFFKNLNPELNRLYAEVVTCFNEGCLLLCTIGLRGLIEGVCRDKCPTEGNLERKINGLVKFLPSLNLIEALHGFRVVGNNAAHELEALNRDDAKAAIEVLEDVLNYLYDLDYRASQITNASRKASSRSDKPGFVN